MRASAEGGCFPTGRHHPGIAHLLRVVAAGLADEFGGDGAMADIEFVSIDTETTGRDPAVDRVVEIAFVTWKNGEVVDRRHFLVNPERSIPKESFDVHGISDDDVKNEPTFRARVDEILQALVGKVPVAYNAEFDKAFLSDELSRAGVSGKRLPPAARRGVEWIDPLVWARELQKEEKSRALSEVAARLGISIERAHRATDDAVAAMAVMAVFFADARVPKTYAAFINEQRRLARLHAEDRQFWRRPM
jgi:DNA polymerase-3 subunit epsilon